MRWRREVMRSRGPARLCRFDTTSIALEFRGQGAMRPWLLLAGRQAWGHKVTAKRPESCSFAWGHKVTAVGESCLVLSWSRAIMCFWYHHTLPTRLRQPLRGGPNLRMIGRTKNIPRLKAHNQRKKTDTCNERTFVERGLRKPALLADGWVGTHMRWSGTERIK